MNRLNESRQLLSQSPPRPFLAIQTRGDSIGVLCDGEQFLFERSHAAGRPGLSLTKKSRETLLHPALQLLAEGG